MSVVIPRNTIIPVKKNKTFVNARGYKNSVGICVYEGERFFCKDNNYLGSFSLSGIPLAPRGEIKFNVCFEIDVDGILTVSAEVMRTGDRKQITITNHGRLSKEEITRMIEEAETFKAQDEERRKIVLAKNALENYANHIWDEVHDYGNIRIEAREKRKMKRAINETFQWLKQNADDAEIPNFEEKLKDLESVCGKFASKLSI